MESFKGLIIVLALIGLFGFALLNFSYSFQTLNHANGTILDDSSMKSLNSSISSNLQGFKSSSSTQLNSTMEEQGVEQNPAGALTLGSVFHIISTFGGFVMGMGGVMLGTAGKVGIDPMTSGILLAMLAVTAVLVFWRLFKWGQ